jgi:flagellar hook-length control protein FliK
MQASLLVAPPMQTAAAQPPLLAQPLANVAAQALLALPEFGAMMAKAMADTAPVDPPAVPAAPSAAMPQTAAGLAPATPPGVTLQPVPPPVDLQASAPLPVLPSTPQPAAAALVTAPSDQTTEANAAVAVEQAVAPVPAAVQVVPVAPAAAAAPPVVAAPAPAKGTAARKTEAADHPRPAPDDQPETASDMPQPAAAMSAVALLAEPPIQAAPDTRPRAAAPSGVGSPASRPRMNVGEQISDAAKAAVPEKPTAAAQQMPAAPRPSEVPSIVPNDLAPANHDHAATAPAMPATPSSPPVSELSATLPPPPAVSPASPPAATAEPASVSPQPSTAAPAAQLAPVLVSMARGPDGAPRMTIRLDPPELGHVQIRIDRPVEAPAHVEITVEKAETLNLLLRDQPQLQRALDQAGVPPDGRSVTIHIAAAEPGSRLEATSTPLPGAAAPSLTGDSSHGANRQGSGSPRHDSGNPDDHDSDPVQIALPAWLRGGLDITA